MEIALANSTQVCYTYDNRSRVTNRTVKDSGDTVISTEDFTHDAAGNITSAPNSCFRYDTNNRLTMYNCQAVSYDMDGNMLSCKLDGKTVSFAYDSANRLISAGGHTYTYNAEDVRIRNLCADEDTTYTYNTNCKLSQLLMKITNGTVTKYVYGRGLIGEEANNAFKTYHFDCRGSTIAITDANCSITDTFRYDTYGKLIERTGESVVIFGYNGRDGVVTDKNGLVYMRARYYSPETRRFVNADIVAGKISNAVTLNRFAYANGNPVSFVDPFGLSVERGSWYGAHADTKKTVTTIDDSYDLTFGLELITLYHKQTITTSKQYGTEGSWFDAYAYTDVNSLEGTASAGVGLKLLYILGFDVNVKALGVEATLSLNAENTSVYVSIDINLTGDTTASVGIVNQTGDNVEVNDQFGISGDTAMVIGVVLALVTGSQMATSVNPQPVPVPSGI